MVTGNMVRLCSARVFFNMSLLAWRREIILLIPVVKWSSRKSPLGTLTAHALVLCSLGGLLLIAAATKSHELIIEPMLQRGVLNPRWLTTSLVEFELFAGVLALYRCLFSVELVNNTLILCCFAMFGASDTNR